ncbi:MAG: hypothetical protein JWM05_220, partial [Acidimicrobiales bacterium]|nr:hypothetical protein [Acidimicrobiales bacterium]
MRVWNVAVKVALATVVSGASSAAPVRAWAQAPTTSAPVTVPAPNPSAPSRSGTAGPGRLSRLASLPVTRLARTTVAPAGRDRLATIASNGGWCWFQDERSIFTSDGRL